MRRCAVLLLGLLLAACSVEDERPAKLAAPDAPLVWPQPPAQPRVMFLHGFRAPQDLGIRPSFLGRVWEAIVGEEQRGMVRPYAIAVRDGLIAIADPGLGAVHLFDPSRKTYERIVEAGGDALISPVGLAFGPDRLYIADSAAERILVLREDNEAPTSIKDVSRPTGIAYAATLDRLYVADTLAHQVVVFDGQGERLFAFGERGTDAGQFNFPTHLFLGDDGHLYVNDTMNFRIQIFDPDGKPVGSFGRHGDGSGDFAQPKGIGLDPEGHVYVADSLFDRIQIFRPDGSFLLAFGGPGAGPGRFWLPAGLFTVGDRIYVADSFNQRVQVFRFLGGG